MNLIEEGMVVTNHLNQTITVESVEKGIYGLLVKGLLPSGSLYLAYCLWELPPGEVIRGWYNWFQRDYFTIQTGEKILKLACVTLGRKDPMPRTVEAFDQRIEETWETIRKEEQDAVSQA